MEPGFARIAGVRNGWAGIGRRLLALGPPGRTAAGQELPGRRGPGRATGQSPGALNEVG
jgi:hypothetical protein